MDILLSIIILTVLAIAIRKIYIDKKNGSKCSSCPYASVCSISMDSKQSNRCEISEDIKNTVINNT